MSVTANNARASVRDPCHATSRTTVTARNSPVNSTVACVIGKGVCRKLHFHPSRRRLFAGMHSAAILAGARLHVGIEGVIERRQVLNEVLHLDLDSVDQRTALEAVPLERIEFARPCRLDDQTN